MSDKAENGFTVEHVSGMLIPEDTAWETIKKNGAKEISKYKKFE